FPLPLAEPDLLLPLNLVVALLLDVQHAVHELRVLIEGQPGVVCLLDRDCDVGPALNRQPAGLLAARASGAAADRLRERLAGDPAEAAATTEAVLRAFHGLLTELLGLFCALLLGGLRQPPQDVGAGGGRDSAKGADRRRNQDLFAL